MNILEQEPRRCRSCGAPVRSTDPGHTSDVPAKPGPTPLIQAIEAYIETWREATRCSIAWRQLMAELRRQGFEEQPAYVCDGIYFRMHEGDLAYLRQHLDTAVAVSGDPVARAAAECRCEAELAKAQAENERWRRAASDLGIPAASALNDIVWDAVDSLDIDGLWSREPSDLTEVVGLLRLIAEVGWYGSDLGDGEPARSTLLGVIRFLEQLL